jgi:tryptophan synthase alpha chain
LEDAGANIASEIGMPYSDPIADGPAIQESINRRWRRSVSLKFFESNYKESVKLSRYLLLTLMGYINPVIQFGIEAAKCQEVGVDGLILPDLPMGEYIEEYAETFKRYGLLNTF